jgi:hypothetical protein
VTEKKEETVKVKEKRQKLKEKVIRDKINAKGAKIKLKRV